MIGTSVLDVRSNSNQAAGGVHPPSQTIKRPPPLGTAANLAAVLIVGVARCGCRKCHPTASRCQFVFVDETTELVGSSYSGEVWIADRRRTRPHRLWIPLIKGAVRPILVVMGDVLG